MSIKGKTEIREAQEYEIRELEKDGEDKKVEVVGYFAKYNSTVELFKGFFETIAKGAFDETIIDGHNIFMLYHHNWSKPLASTKAGTLKLTSDDTGLKFEAVLNTKLSYVKDILELVKDQLIQGCSFGFRCIEEEIEYNSETDVYKRVLTKVELFEGSLLCIPAYDDTSVFTRVKEIKEEEIQRLKEDNFFKEMQETVEEYEKI